MSAAIKISAQVQHYLRHRRALGFELLPIVDFRQRTAFLAVPTAMLRI